MSSGVEAAIALDAAVVLSLGTNRILGGAGKLTGAGAQALAAIAEGRAEAHAAALAEVERHQKAVRAVLECNARIAVLTESGDRYRAQVPIPVPLEVAGMTVEDLVAWTDATVPLLDEAEEKITRHIAASMVASIFQVPARSLRVDTAQQVLRSEVQGAEVERSAVERSEVQPPKGNPRAETLVRVMSRLVPDTTEADRRHVAEAAERFGAATGDGEAEGLLTEVRLRVQAANVRTAERRVQAAADAARREAAEQAAAERAYLLDAVTSAFGELGYQVDEGFETLTTRDGALVLSKDGWPDHAIKMRVDDAAQIRAALVRTAEPVGEEERRIDVAREEEWCTAFEAARKLLTEAGVHSDVRWRIDPGEHRLPVAPEARQTRSRPRQRERERRQERER